MREHFDIQKQTRIHNERIDAFIEAVLDVCVQHGFSIGHEDAHGAFIIEPCSQHNVEWLRAAHIDLGDLGRRK